MNNSQKMTKQVSLGSVYERPAWAAAKNQPGAINLREDLFFFFLEIRIDGAIQSPPQEKLFLILNNRYIAERKFPRKSSLWSSQVTWERKEWLFRCTGSLDRVGQVDEIWRLLTYEWHCLQVAADNYGNLCQYCKKCARFIIIIFTDLLILAAKIWEDQSTNLGLRMEIPVHDPVSLLYSFLLTHPLSGSLIRTRTERIQKNHAASNTYIYVCMYFF